MSKKKRTQESVFRKVSQSKTDMVFDTTLVKKISTKIGFKNQYDTFHIDNTSKLPPLFKRRDYFVVHLGKGRHKFVKGIRYGFHTFEEIKENDVKEWDYRSSILNEINTSEANVLSVAYNQKILHDFLYEDIRANPKIYLPHRTKFSADYTIKNETVSIIERQIEVDMTTEQDKVVTVFEAKNGFPADFLISQIYLPFLYYTKQKEEKGLDIKEINTCYLLCKRMPSESIIRMYKYTFTDPYDMTSIKLLKNKEYRIMKR